MLFCQGHSILVEKESPWVQISNYPQGFLHAQQLHIQHISLQLTTVTKAANYSYSGHRAMQEGCSLYWLCKLGSACIKRIFIHYKTVVQAQQMLILSTAVFLQ